MINALSKIKFYTISLKRNILSIILVLFTISLVIFSKSNFEAAKEGLFLWGNNVIPSLLPFFIATELLQHTNIIIFLGKYLNNIMRPLFNVPGEGAFAFIMGIISGYPTGAKIVSDLKEKNLCTSIEAERLIAFTNNSGPLFIIGTVGISFFGNTTIGFLLLISHVLACISVGFLFRFWKKDNKSSKKQNYSYKNSDNISLTFSNLGEILGISIKKSISTICLIGGFVILFSVILSIFEKSNITNILSTIINPIFQNFGISTNFSIGFINGFIELTNRFKRNFKYSM